MYFLTKFSSITTEYVNPQGANDPIEFLVRLGENPSSQASLVTLCGIARKLGGSLGQSWEKMIEVLCHLYFLGLFPIAQYNNHQYKLLSENELANFVVMVNGLMEEKFSNRKGLISRLLTWSRENEQDEQQIQKMPIDPLLWIDFQEMLDHMDEKNEGEIAEMNRRMAVNHPMRGNDSNLNSNSNSNSMAKKMNESDESDDSDDSDESDESEESEDRDHREGNETNKKQTRREVFDESSDYSDSSDFDDAPFDPIQFELTPHEIQSIETVLECIEKCQLNALLSSSVEWSNNTLLIIIKSAIKLAQSPYRSLFSAFR